MRVPDTDSCVEVGAADLEDGANGLQVRRGSEPTLHQDTLPPQRPVIICLYSIFLVLFSHETTFLDKFDLSEV